MRPIHSLALTLLILAPALPGVQGGTTCVGPADEACLTERTSTIEGCDSSLYIIRSGTASATLVIVECPNVYCAELWAPVIIGGGCTAHDPHLAGGAVCYESKRISYTSNGNGLEVYDYENVTVCHGVISNAPPAYPCVGTSTDGERTHTSWSFVCVGVVANPGTCASQPGDVLYVRANVYPIGEVVNQRVACSF